MPPKSYPLKRSFSKVGFADGKSKRRQRKRIALAIPRRAPSLGALSSAFAKNSRFTRQAGKSSSILPGMPDKKYVTLRFCDTYSLTGGIGAVYHKFRLNSLYDPDLTGVGHQPLGHDEYAEWYERYTVRRARIKVTYIGDAVAAIVPGVMMIGVNDDETTQTSSTATAMERGDFSEFMHVGTIPGQAIEKSIVQEVDIAKLQGVKNITDEDDLGAAFGANPAQSVVGHVGLFPVAGNTPGTINFAVEIEMDVVLTEPKPLIGS